MTQLTSIGAAMFSDLSVAIGVATSGVAAQPTPATYDSAGFTALFTTTASNPKYLQVGNVREFPAIGSPANIVNVPVYGQKTSQTIGGQANPPSLEVKVNYVPSLWVKGSTQTVWTSNVVSTAGSELGNMVNDGKKRAWRLSLLMAQPTGATLAAGLSQYDSATGGIGASGVENSQFFWMGKLESLLVTPSLTDATMATLAFSIQSDFYGPYTTT